MKIKILKKLCAALLAAAAALASMTAAAETVTLPAKSVYVVTCAEDGATPILEMSESKSLSVTSVNLINSLQIFRCGKNGEDSEPVYESGGDIRGSFKMSVRRGECYYFKIGCVGGIENEKLIIK